METNEQIGANVERIYHQKSEEYDCVKSHLDQLERDIKKAKEVADYVIMIMHSGGQYNIEIDPYSQYLAAKIKEFGADIIIGHHPHIIQECENKEGYLTVFSLGNFMDSPFVVGEQVMDFRYNAVLHLTLRKKADKVVAEKQFALYKIIEGDDYLHVTDTYDLYDETKDEKLKEEILYFANRFAGEKKYDSVQELYNL